MKHYLDLVPISAKIHKKQSRMSIFCIVLAVFLVTTIFGMADMFIRSQILQAQQESGNWHIAIKNISNEEAAIIASRPDIEVFSPYGVLNYRGDLGYTLGGKDVAICGCDESYITEIWTDQLEEGVFPQTSNEALVTENAKQIMGVAIGDPIAVETPDGDKLNFTISGFMNNTASIMSGDSYGIILNTEDYCAIYPNVSDGEPNDYGIMFFTQFANTRNIQGKIADTELIELLSEHEPDIIVITGDLIDAGHTDIEIAFDFIKQAVQIAPVYFVTGNHEANFSHYDQFKTGLEASGVTVLEDEAIQLVHNNEMITLIGLSDSDFTIKGDMFNEAPAMVNTKLNSLIDDENSYTILLSHRPELFETYVCCGVDLVLCGHAHGGQFRLPFIGGLVAPNQGLFPKYDSGLYTDGKTNMVVSRGLGNSIIPFRFNNRPEVVLVELNTE